jgi:hypothetical protein
MPSKKSGPAFDALLFGAPSRLGVIVATTTAKNNNDTGTPFNNTGDALAGKVVMVQPDAACTLAVGSSSVAAVSTDERLEANEKRIINMPLSSGYVSLRAVTGTVNGQVYELIG